MELYYRINKGDIQKVPRYWKAQFVTDYIILYIYEYLITTAILFKDNEYIGYKDGDQYTILITKY